MTSCLILAAGNGTRMKTEYPKVLAEVLSAPMLSWVLESVMECGIQKKCVVTGYENDKVENFLKENSYECDFAFQSERKGTAHAVMAARKFLSELSGDILIIGGDSPFIDSITIMAAYDQHKKDHNSATIISANLENPYGYGRIIRNSNGVQSIVEEREANDSQKNIKEVNSGAYWFNVDDLLKYIGSIDVSSSGEIYLTSIISLFIEKKLNVGAFCASDSTIALGANTPEELENLNNIAKDKFIKSLISRGVNIPDYSNVTISKNVEIGEGTTIFSHVVINACTKIGKNCEIGPGITLSGENVPDNTRLICMDQQNYKSKEVTYAT